MSKIYPYLCQTPTENPVAADIKDKPKRYKGNYPYVLTNIGILPKSHGIPYTMKRHGKSTPQSLTTEHPVSRLQLTRHCQCDHWSCSMELITSAWAFYLEPKNHALPTLVMFLLSPTSQWLSLLTTLHTHQRRFN